MPLTTYITSYFLTARLAARRMLPNKSGVIMTVTAPPARIGTPNGGYGPSQGPDSQLVWMVQTILSRSPNRINAVREITRPQKPISAQHSRWHEILWNVISCSGV